MDQTVTDINTQSLIIAPDVMSLMSTLSSESSGSNSGLNLVEHPSLYYSDGNLILIAENIKFRVYGGHLARRSNIFKDMIAIGQPEGSVMVDGCPAVHLDDPAELVGHLLEIMLSGVEVLRMMGYPTWPQVKASLELGAKYEIDDILAEGMSHVNAWFPKDISQWDESLHANDPPPSDEYRTWFEWSDIANTCRKLNLNELHLRVLYLCCGIPTSFLINGCPLDQADEVLYTGDEQETSGSSGTTAAQRLVKIIQLHPDDIVSCLDARTELSSARVTWMLLFSGRDPPKKDDPSHIWRDCKEGAKAMRKKVVADSGNLSHHDPLCGLGRSYFDDLGLCASCVTFYLRLIKEQRQKVMNRLSELIRDDI